MEGIFQESGGTGKVARLRVAPFLVWAGRQPRALQRQGFSGRAGPTSVPSWEMASFRPEDTLLRVFNLTPKEP
jgi:hypothetical protein